MVGLIFKILAHILLQISRDDACRNFFFRPRRTWKHTFICGYINLFNFTIFFSTFFKLTWLVYPRHLHQTRLDFQIPIIAGQCRTNPWPVVPDWPWCRLPMPAALASMPMPSYATSLHFRSAITISLYIINVPSYHRQPNYLPGLSLSLSPLWSQPPPPPHNCYLVLADACCSTDHILTSDRQQFFYLYAVRVLINNNV